MYFCPTLLFQSLKLWIVMSFSRFYRPCTFASISLCERGFCKLMRMRSPNLCIYQGFIRSIHASRVYAASPISNVSFECSQVVLGSRLSGCGRPCRCIAERAWVWFQPQLYTMRVSFLIPSFGSLTDLKRFRGLNLSSTQLQIWFLFSSFPENVGLEAQRPVPCRIHPGRAGIRCRNRLHRRRGRRPLRHPPLRRLPGNFPGTIRLSSKCFASVFMQGLWWSLVF